MFKWIICYVFGCKYTAFWCKNEYNWQEIFLCYNLLTQEGRGLAHYIHNDNGITIYLQRLDFPFSITFPPRRVNGSWCHDRPLGCPRIHAVPREWTLLSQPPLFLLFLSYHKIYFCCKNTTFIWNQQINPRNFCRLRFICYFIATFRATLCHESVMPILMLLDSKNAD